MASTIHFGRADPVALDLRSHRWRPRRSWELAGFPRFYAPRDLIEWDINYLWQSCNVTFFLLSMDTFISLPEIPACPRNVSILRALQSRGACIQNRLESKIGLLRPRSLRRMVDRLDRSCSIDFWCKNTASSGEDTRTSGSTPRAQNHG